MKKILLLFVTIAMMGGVQSAYAQRTYKNADAAVEKAESIIKSYSGKEEAEVVSIGSLLINMAKPFVADSEARAALKVATGLLVADLEDCAQDVKDRFNSEMSKFVNSIGELKVMEARDGEDCVIIIGDENKISGMLLYSGDCEVVLIKLAAKPEQLEELMQMVND